MPVIAGVSFLAAGVLVMIGVGAMLWPLVGPHPRPPIQARPTVSGWPPIPATPEPTNIPPLEIIAGPSPSPSPSPTPEPWAFGRVDFSRTSPVLMIFNLETGPDDVAVAISEFTPHVWTPELFASGLFNPRLEDDHGVAWLDDADRIGLWLHSGTGEAAFEIQEVLERDQHGYFRNYRDVQPLLNRYIAGSLVELYQGDVRQNAYIAAAVRIGPQGVADLQQHVMDMAEYLGIANDLYSDDVLMIYFCGRLLNGEGAYRIPNESPWQQARFILALVPAMEAR